ncbi:NUDIX hydrolase [Listeria floridensis FSL S10-1187]|uniref:NUDIX hydrolase n=1 Tax=Listeria floridensis FSL S10-1187 TaxID=1265817 RepID=A0ABN0RF69_9LIST|nr:NUDIX domain-containing protein [Listeria floridensis]EUJ31809.1 NUDIX hydrolase [Listeria floridensis FSL S10-1187]
MDYIKWIRTKVGHDQIILNFAGGCLLNKNREVLLQKRSDRASWGFPGGAVELGESVCETVEREFYEETGLKVITKELIGVYSKYEDCYPNGDKAQPILFFFHVEYRDGELFKETNNETLELAFFPLDQVPKLVNEQHDACYRDLMCYEGKPFIR